MRQDALYIPSDHLAGYWRTHLELFHFRFLQLFLPAQVVHRPQQLLTFTVSTVAVFFAQRRSQKGRVHFAQPCLGDRELRPKIRAPNVFVGIRECRQELLRLDQ